MRTILFYVMILLTVASCSDTTTGSRIIVLDDITETDFAVKPTAEALIPKLGLQDDLWKPSEFRYSTISDVSVNRRFQQQLPAAHELLGNAIERQKNVSLYLQNIDSVLKQSNTVEAKQYSSIWKPLLNELKYFQQDTVTATTIFLYSDLRENSRLWSSYRTADVMRLMNDFESVKTQFLSQAKAIKKSNTIKVVVVYQPKTPLEDEHYGRMVRLYTALFEAMEIPIEFVANL